MKNHHTTEGPPALPRVAHLLDACYRVDYGPSRGWREFTTRVEAEQDLVNFIDMRINSLSRELFELCRLKRKVLK